MNKLKMRLLWLLAALAIFSCCSPRAGKKIQCPEINYEAYLKHTGLVAIPGVMEARLAKCTETEMEAKISFKFADGYQQREKTLVFKKSEQAQDFKILQEILATEFEGELSECPREGGASISLTYLVIEKQLILFYQFDNEGWCGAKRFATE